MRIKALISPERLLTDVFRNVELDFLEMVKMINYIRAMATLVGSWPPDLSSKEAFDDEHWLRPQLEDDALLYSLNDILGEDLEDVMGGVTSSVGQIDVAPSPRQDYYLSDDPRPDNPIYKIGRMEAQLRVAQQGLLQHKQLLAMDMQLKARLEHGSTWEGALRGVGGRDQEQDAFENDNISRLDEDNDSSYFASYSGHGKCIFNIVRLPNADVNRHP